MIGINHSRRLRDKICIARYKLDCVAATLWTHTRLPELYPEFLFSSHSIIRASVPLMQMAADRCQTSFPSDPVGAGIYIYFTQHIPEEMNHDDWVLEDLDVLGFDRHEVLKRIPSASVAALVGAQYYWIQHQHPVALLGYIAVLEGTPPDIEFFERTADRTGIPRAAFSNLRRHGMLDPRHREELDHALDQLPLTDYHHALMGVSAFQTIHLLAHVIEDIVISEDQPVVELRPMGALP